MATYTKADKEKAVALYLEHGAGHAAAQLGCTERTIYRWLGEVNVSRVTDEKRAAERDETLTRHQAKRSAIREQMLDAALDLLARLREPHTDYRGKDVVPVHWEVAPSGDAQRYVTSVGILIDKYRLEMGETTGRQEHLTFSPADLELQRVLDEFNRASST
jgi:transposase-like protein